MTGSNQRKMHLVAITITKQNMNKELVVIKYGGGLITYKDQLCEANHAHINGLSEVVIQWNLDLRNILGMAKKFLKSRCFLFQTPQNP